MDKQEILVTDEMIEKVWGNARFGEVPKREIVNNTLLKCACGYETGKTARSIVEELGLVTGKWELTIFGKRYLFAAYSGGKSL